MGAKRKEKVAMAKDKHMWKGHRKYSGNKNTTQLKELLKLTGTKESLNLVENLLS
jgi:hypothetical protein